MPKDIEQLKTSDSTVEQRLLELLQSHPDTAYTTAELAEHGDCDRSHARHLMNRHEERGNVDSKKVPEESNTRYYWWVGETGDGDAEQD